MDFREAGCLGVDLLFRMDQMIVDQGEPLVINLNVIPSLSDSLSSGI